MTKLKVGDKVRFKPFQEEWRTQGPHYTERMQEISQETNIGIVLSITDKGWVVLEKIRYFWMSDWLLPNKTRVFK